MRLFLRFCGFLFAAGTIVFLVSIGAGAGLLWHFSKDLPDYSQLQDYEPPVMTRVHATDGALVAEYATQRRLYIPIQAVPKMVINAFLAAEDKNFYDHNGLDFQGMTRAAIVYAQNYGSNRRPQGASTITQQVAKNFLLTNEVSFTRKIKEALLALKIERTYSKDKILELYLNEIYLGFSAYGIAAASLMYFDKSVHELTIPEAAYLAALPKAPSSLHPFRARERAIERRNYVIDQMVLTGVVKQADADKFKKEPLTVTARPTGSHIFAADYFAEEVRRWIYDKYGEKTLYEGGLSVRTTLDPKLQVQARTALVDGLIKFDEGQGWRGPVQKLKPEGDWGVKLSEVKQLNDVAPWRLSVVLATSDQSATVGLYPPREPGGALSKERATGVVPLDAVKWAKAAEGPTRGRVPTRVNQVLRGRRRRLRRAAQQGSQHLAAAPGAGGFRRDGRDGPVDRPRAGDGRRLLVRSEPVQPRDPGDAPAGLVVQAVRLCRRARQRLHAVDRGDGRADRNQPGPGRSAVAAGELFDRQVLRPVDAAHRHRIVAQHHDGAARAGRRHAADRGIRAAVRRL